MFCVHQHLLINSSSRSSHCPLLLSHPSLKQRQHQRAPILWHAPQSCAISPNHLNLQPANTSRFWVKRPLESPQPPAVWMTSSTKPDVTSMIPSIALLVLRQSCRPQRERCSSLSWPDCATAFGLSGVSSRNRHRRGTQDAI
jgi:hypothetical protein